MSPTIVKFAVALIAILFSATSFTNRVEILEGRLGMRQGAMGSLLAEVGAVLPGGLIALVLAPLATKLPKKFSSIFCVMHGKDTLPLGNMTSWSRSSRATSPRGSASSSRPGISPRWTSSVRCWASPRVG